MPILAAHLEPGVLLEVGHFFAEHEDLPGIRLDQAKAVLSSVVLPLPATPYTTRVSPARI